MIYKRLLTKAKKLNEKFNSLSREQQRTLILKDAIKQINAGKFIATEGNYISPDSTAHSSLQVNILNSPECQCCAKGALFAACVMNNNKVNESECYNWNHFVVGKLRTWFPKRELDMMEVAFELATGLDGNKINGDSKVATQCMKFGSMYNNEHERLLAILRNTLKYGKFDPSKLPSVVELV